MPLLRLRSIFSCKLQYLIVVRGQRSAVLTLGIARERVSTLKEYGMLGEDTVDRLIAEEAPLDILHSMNVSNVLQTFY